jgi:hypothetical protein
MGACECDNPMEFGYEVNSIENENEPNNNEKKKFFSKLNYEKNINNKEKINLNYQNYSQNNSDNFISIENERNPKEIKPEQNTEEKEIIINPQNKEEGVNALKSRFEINEEITNDIYLNGNNNNDNNSSKFYFTTTAETPKDDFSIYIFENINKIRENPQSFIEIIEQAKKNIILDQRGIYIYKSTVKVALSKGLPAFDEAIDFLKQLKPMNKLIFSNELLIESPINEEQIKDKKYMNEQINKKVQNGIPIKSFWRDIIKDCKTCLILMIVDDTGVNSGKKRNDILDPNMQCIGIVSKKIGKSFASYITLC